MANNQDDKNDPLEWSRLSVTEKELVVKATLAIRKYKFLVLAIGSIFLSIQPIINNFYNSREKDRQAEITKLELAQGNSNEIMKQAVANMMNLSSELGQLRSENAALKTRISNLESELKKYSAGP